jgi:hypothetical protein
MNRKRLLMTLVAGLVLTAAAGMAEAKQVLVTLDPNTSGCLDGDLYSFQVGSVGAVQEPVGVPVTFRLRKVGVPGAIAGPTTTTVFSAPFFASDRPDLFPGVFRICANNDVSGQRVKVQLVINGF